MEILAIEDTHIEGIKHLVINRELNANDFNIDDWITQEYDDGKYAMHQQPTANCKVTLKTAVLEYLQRAFHQV